MPPMKSAIIQPHPMLAAQCCLYKFTSRPGSRIIYHPRHTPHMLDNGSSFMGKLVMMFYKYFSNQIPICLFDPHLKLHKTRYVAAKHITVKYPKKGLSRGMLKIKLR